MRERVWLVKRNFEGDIMMKKIMTQAELDGALANDETEFEFIKAGTFEINYSKAWVRVSAAASLKYDVLIRAWENSSVIARGSSRVEARGSSRVEARENSSVVAWGSSSVVARGSSRVEARESSRVIAWENSSVVARGSSRVEARGSSSVIARESSSVVAWESSRVVAWESSRVVARGSSRVEARESSRVVARENSSVVARGSSSVVARGSSRVEARGFVSLTAFGGTLKLSAKCHVFLCSKKAKVRGGQKTEAYIETAQDWCDFYGIEVKRGIATVYKAVRNDYASARDASFFYHPGSKPKAPEFDPITECGKGLHFSPHPRMAKEFYSADDMKFIACPVKLSEIVIHPEGSCPEKCKAPRVYGACYEVDEDGNKIKVKEAS